VESRCVCDSHVKSPPFGTLQRWCVVYAWIRVWWHPFIRVWWQIFICMWWQNFACTLSYSYIPTYTHGFWRRSIRTYTHTYMNTYLRTCIPTQMKTHTHITHITDNMQHIQSCMHDTECGCKYVFIRTNTKHAYFLVIYSCTQHRFQPQRISTRLHPHNFTRLHTHNLPHLHTHNLTRLHTHNHTHNITGSNHMNIPWVLVHTCAHPYIQCILYTPSHMKPVGVCTSRHTVYLYTYANTHRPKLCTIQCVFIHLHMPVGVCTSRHTVYLYTYANIRRPKLQTDIVCMHSHMHTSCGCVHVKTLQCTYTHMHTSTCPNCAQIQYVFIQTCRSSPAHTHSHQLNTHTLYSYTHAYICTP